MGQLKLGQLCAIGLPRREEEEWVGGRKIIWRNYCQEISKFIENYKPTDLGSSTYPKHKKHYLKKYNQPNWLKSVILERILKATRREDTVHTEGQRFKKCKLD